MKQIIGRKEKISLEEWGLKNISAKIDTGAYTSAIHCDFVQEKKLGGKEVLEFILLSPKHKHYKDQLVRTEHFSQKKVKNSFGQVEIRYKVTTKIRIFDQEFEAEFTLSERSKMRNPILLGRKILKGRFLIDVDKTYLSSHKNQ